MNLVQLHTAKSTACEVQAAEREGVLESMRKKVANFSTAFGVQAAKGRRVANRSTAFGVQAAEGEGADESMVKEFAKMCCDLGLPPLPEGKQYSLRYIEMHLEQKKYVENKEKEKVMMERKRKEKEKEKKKKSGGRKEGGLTSKVEA